MYIYGIENVNIKRNNKKKIIMICLIILAILAIAILGGMKLAQNINEKKLIAKNENNAQESQNEQEISNKPNNNEQTNLPTEEKEINKEVNFNKLTQEQINRINTIYQSNEKRAFLTFDDGPSSQVTPKILETLKQENIKATFFVLGTMVKSNPELVKRAREEGHYIANHGYSHVYKKIYADEKKPLEEYQKTNELIRQALEDNTYQSNVFRYPGGSYGGYYEKIKTKSKEVLKENGIAYLDWNALTNDSDGADTKEKIIKNLKATCKGKNSVVILMHDAPNKALTAETLPDVIQYLKEQGYSFKNLYDIL